MANGLLLFFLVGFFLVGSAVGFGGCASVGFVLVGGMAASSSFSFSSEAIVRLLHLFLCEREVGLIVIPDGGSFVCVAAAGSNDCCVFRSPTAWSVAADFYSPLLLAELLADVSSAFSIRLDGCSGRWLLRRFQVLQWLCGLEVDRVFLQRASDGSDCKGEVLLEQGVALCNSLFLQGALCKKKRIDNIPKSDIRFGPMLPVWCEV
jgi:hypothetical protein